MRRTLLVIVGLLSLAAPAVAQSGMLPAPAPPPPVTVVTSVAAQSGVRLALVQSPDAPVIVDSVAHTEDRLAGLIHLRNRTARAVSTVALAFTIGSAPTANTPVFRHVEAVSVTLNARQSASLDAPGVPLRLLQSLISAEAPVVEVAVVGVRFANGQAWRAPGRESWLGRPDLATPLACVDDLGQTQPVDPLTAVTAGASVCQGGGQ